MPLNILICGGGIAGPSLAYFLSRLGHRITIVERWPALRAHGAQIDLRAQGLVIAERMGLLEAIRRKTVQEDGFEMLDQKGRSVAKFPVNKSGKGGQGLISEFEIMRGDLIRVLYEATCDKVEYVFGKTVEHFEQDEKKVTAHFSDGGSGSYDILVGADGQGSRIRRAILPPDEDPLVHMGIYLAHWNIPVDESASRFGRGTHAPGGRVFWTRLHNGQAAFQLRDASASLHGMPRLPVKEQMAFWTDRFADAGWIAPQLAKEMENSEYFYCSESIQVKPSTYSSGRVVLLGDAASCPGPTGMGTTNALVGAYLLAGEIAQIPDLQPSLEDVRCALDGYESIMRPFSQQLQKIWPGVFRFVMPESRFGVWLLRFVAKWIARLRVPTLAASFGREENGKGVWQVPVYSRLDCVKQ